MTQITTNIPKVAEIKAILVELYLETSESFISKEETLSCYKLDFQLFVFGFSI